MNLSLKAAHFLIEALEHYQHHYDQRLEVEALSEDEISDLVNDRHFLEAIKQDLQKYRAELLKQR